MAAFTKTEESYIEHEVKLRLHEHKFSIMEKSLEHMNSKLNWILGIVLSAVFLPVGLHYLHLM
jgi:hypothetical protein